MSIQRTIRMGPQISGVVTHMNWSNKVVTVRHAHGDGIVNAAYRLDKHAGCTKRTVFEGASITFRTKGPRIGVASAYAGANDEIVEISDPIPCIDPVALSVLKTGRDWRTRLEEWHLRAIIHGEAWSTWGDGNNTNATYRAQHGRLMVKASDYDAGLAVDGTTVFIDGCKGIPQTTLNAMKGGRLCDVIGHPWLAHPAALVDDCQVERGRLVLRTKSPLIRISRLLQDAADKL